MGLEEDESDKEYGLESTFNYDRTKDYDDDDEEAEEEATNEDEVTSDAEKEEEEEELAEEEEATEEVEEAAGAPPAKKAKETKRKPAAKKSTKPKTEGKDGKSSTKDSLKQTGYRKHVLEAIWKLQSGRGGVSRQKIIAYIKSEPLKDTELPKTFSTLITKALKQCIEFNWVNQTTGTGASGSFRMSNDVKRAHDGEQKIKRPRRNLLKIRKTKTPKKLAIKKQRKKKRQQRQRRLQQQPLEKGQLEKQQLRKRALVAAKERLLERSKSSPIQRGNKQLGEVEARNDPSDDNKDSAIFYFRKYVFFI